jgi:hypothetical protein
MQFDIERPEDPSEKSPSIRVDVHHLPDYYAANQFAKRSDLRAPRRKVGSISDTQDLEGTVRRLVTAPGAYLAAAYVGRDMTDSQVFEIQPKGQMLEAEAKQDGGPGRRRERQQAAAVASQQDAPEGSSARNINDTTETIRATKELLKEVAPPAAPPVTLDAEQIAERAAAKVLEAMKPAQLAQPPDAFETIRQTLALQEQMRAAIERDRPREAEKSDPIESMFKMYERVEELRERIAPAVENPNAGFGDKLLSTFNTGLRMLEKSGAGNLVGQMLLAKVMQGAHAAQQPHIGAQPALPPESASQAAGAPAGAPPSQLPPALASVLELVVSEATRDAPTDKAADAIVSLAVMQPEMGALLGEVMGMPPHQVVETVAKLSGHAYLVNLPYSIEWFTTLRGSISERMDAMREAREEEDADAADDQQGGGDA